MQIIVKEYQIYFVSQNDTEFIKKRRLLCQSEYFFFEDTDQDLIQKVQLTIKDNDGLLVFNKTYSQIDRVNRNFSCFGGKERWIVLNLACLRLTKCILDKN